jgi:uncharacterized protein with HEPN domain
MGPEAPASPQRRVRSPGEAANAFPEDLRTLAPEVPWHNIMGMRNVLVHGYLEIHTDVVWDAATWLRPLQVKGVNLGASGLIGNQN